MSGPFRRIITGIVFFLLIFAVATVGYLAAGWELMDSIYMVIITIFGVGYGEVQPITSPGLRALTISVIIGGYAAVIYTVGGFVQMLIDGELNKALGNRRMTKEMERLSGHTIVCGFGRMGSMLTQELAKAGKPFVVIDQDAESIKNAETLRYLVIHGNATEESVLERAGIHRARSLAAVLSDDAQNLFITITAHDMNPAMEILARGEFPATESKLLRCGASRVVSPATIGAIRMAHLITHPSAESLLQESDQQASLNEELAHIGLHLDELHLPADSSLVGSSLGDIEIKGHGGFLIVAIRRADNTVQLHPTSEEVFRIGDTLIVVGHQSDLPRLAERLAVKKAGMTYRGTRIS